MVALRVLISAGEASGDLYASQLTAALKRRYPEAEFFGCAGPRMREQGVRAIVPAESLAVVGLLEVVSHLPRIYGEYRKLSAAIEDERPDLAILTDSPDFHLRLAGRLKRQGVPVVYLIAPQVWAWREGRVRVMRRLIDHLLCIFPFEEQYFRNHGIAATYIGHPLARTIRPSLSKAEFFQRHSLADTRPLVALLPGSRQGEAGRHVPFLLEAVAEIQERRDASFVMGLPQGFTSRTHGRSFSERISGSPIQVIEGLTWDVLAYSDVALAASGTVTIEGALLGTPMVTFYQVNALSWWLGRRLVRAPFLSMVNLVAGRAVVTELMQSDMTGARLAQEALALLQDREARVRMKGELALVAQKLCGPADPMEAATTAIDNVLNKERVHAS